METQLSERVQTIKPSPTLAVTARAAELRAAGQDVIGLGAGEPDFDTPEHIKAAAKKALDEGFTKYTPVDGIPSLKQAIIDKCSHDNGIEYRPSEVVVSCGAKHSLFNLTQALLNPGDEAIIPAPYWVSYPDMVVLTGAKSVIIDAGIERGYKITAEQLEQAISDRSRLLILNSPSNPTGATYSREELESLGQVLLRHPQILVATDDIYEHIRWDDAPFVNIIMACPELRDRAVLVHGVSKSYAMTGWRIGYAAGPERMAQAMRKIQSQSTSNPTSIAQVAAQAALAGDQGCVTEMVRVFKERHDYVVARLNGLMGVRCLPGQGAFYAFPDFRDAIAKLDNVTDDLALAEQLIEQAGVAVVPGSAFGAVGHARISFATSMENLQEAMDRLERFFGAE